MWPFELDCYIVLPPWMYSRDTEAVFLAWTLDKIHRIRSRRCPESSCHTCGTFVCQMRSHLSEISRLVQVRGDTWLECAGGGRGLIRNNDCFCLGINTTCVWAYRKCQGKSGKQFTCKQKRVRSSSTLWCQQQAHSLAVQQCKHSEWQRVNTA